MHEIFNGINDIEKIIGVSPAVLGTLAVIIAIQVVGTLQFIKNFLPPRFGKKYGIIAFLLTALGTFMNSELVPLLGTFMYDVMFLALSINTLSYQVVKDNFPKMVEKAMMGKIASKE